MLEKNGYEFMHGRRKASPVVGPGEFVFSAAHLDHGHIFGMTRALIEAGGTLRSVWDPDPKKRADFLKAFPGTAEARCEEEILADPAVSLVAGAAVTNERCAFGLRVMNAGKDYFTDKAPMTTLDQVDAAREAVRRTGRKYMVYYSERLHVECAVLAGYLIEDGLIGRVLSVSGFGPHRIGPPSGRPGWFWQREPSGGILCDIGSHQIEQYLFYAGEEDARICAARIANYAHPDAPGFDDFGDCALTGKGGTTNYFRVDWFTPDGLRTWGDGRTLILGTEGYIEMRKFIDVAADRPGGNHLFLVNGDGEQYIGASGVTGFPFFGDLILDCLDRTERAMTQEHAFKAAELSIRAQAMAADLTPRAGR
ncbi:MAG: Gfo/Idh/MocA family oxidoreductase [Clostridiales bacterium]|nr:Gfo/Idh/MocA family oxidoreductase [Clostridiales bacterium]